MDKGFENNKCQLCGKDEQVGSHIIPKFIFKWLKKTGTGRLRKMENINIPIQDGIVKPFLCEECEGKFNKRETYFANTFFYPVINNIEEIKYNGNLKYFIVSVFWRVLKDELYKEVEKTIWYDTLLSVEKKWADYLLHDKPLNQFSNFHILTGVNVLSNDNFIMYMSRMIDAGIPNDENICFFYVKLPRIVIVLPIGGINESSFINTSIKQNGTYYINNAIIKEEIIGDYLLFRSNLFLEELNNKSDKQKKATHDFISKRNIDIEKTDLGIIDNYIKNKK